MSDTHSAYYQARPGNRIPLNTRGEEERIQHRIWTNVILSCFIPYRPGLTMWAFLLILHSYQGLKWIRQQDELVCKHAERGNLAR